MQRVGIALPFQEYGFRGRSNRYNGGERFGSNDGRHFCTPRKTIYVISKGRWTAMDSFIQRKTGVNILKHGALKSDLKL